MLILFWLSVFIIVYSYFGYPLVLFLLSLVSKRKVEKDPGYTPYVTLIITVHNEQKRVLMKIQNTLELDYPKDRLEVIFASDYSSDKTDEIIKEYEQEGIQLVRSPHRGGKEFAQKCALEKSHGEVIVFTDVATILEKEALQKIVANFSDKTIGCVSSEDRFIDEQGKVSGEGAYVRYEMWLRSLESKVNSVVGLSGSFFAARKEICVNWATNIPSDFNTLLNCIKAGYRGISDPDSMGIYTNIKDQNKEFDRKVRTITRGLSAFMKNVELLNPFQYGIFSWQLFSHKLMRWFVPWFLVLALFTNVFLAVKNAFYSLMLAIQVVCYFLAAAGRVSANGSVLLKIPFYFIQVNHAIAVAWIKYIKGERFVTWSPSNR